jgi:multimeric flavodoxin WrbA
MRSVRVVGLGGSLREQSTSRTALETALEGAAVSGAETELIRVRDLDLPLYTDEQAVGTTSDGGDEGQGAGVRGMMCDGLVRIRL